MFSVGTFVKLPKRSFKFEASFESLLSSTWIWLEGSSIRWGEVTITSTATWFESSSGLCYERFEWFSGRFSIHVNAIQEHCRICLYQAQILTQRIIRNTTLFYNFTVLLIYSKFNQFIKYEKQQFSQFKTQFSPLPTPGEKAKIEKNTYLMLKRLKPQINQPTVIHSITPNTHNL